MSVFPYISIAGRVVSVYTETMNQPKKLHRLTLDLPEALATRLKVAAAKSKRTMKAMCEEWIVKGLEAEEKGAANGAG